MALEKYTPEQEQQLLELYQRDTSVESISNTLNKSTRSIIAKLSRLGVYQSKFKTTGPRLTKMQLVDELEDLLQLEPQTLHSVEKADRDAILALLAAVKGQKFKLET